MRNLWILTRFLLKSGPGKSNQKSGKKKAFSDGGRIVVYLLLGVCLLPVSVLLFLLGYSGYTFAKPLGNSSVSVGWSKIATRMIMRHDNASGAVGYGFCEYFARVDQ